MAENTLQGLMKTTMDNLKQMIDVNTIVGDPVETVDGTIIIPVSKLTVGFGSGGTEKINTSPKKFDEENSYPFGGGSGAGISVSPVSFLVVSKDQVRMLPVGQVNTLERIVDNLPDVIEKIVDKFTSNDKKDICYDDYPPINPS